MNCNSLWHLFLSFTRYKSQSFLCISYKLDQLTKHEQTQRKIIHEPINTNTNKSSNGHLNMNPTTTVGFAEFWIFIFVGLSQIAHRLGLAALTVPVLWAERIDYNWFNQSISHCKPWKNWVCRKYNHQIFVFECL